MKSFLLLLPLFFGLLVSCSEKSNDQSNNYTEPQDKTQSTQPSEYADHTIRVYPLPPFLDSSDTYYILDKTALERSLAKSKEGNDDPFDESTSKIDTSDLEATVKNEPKGFKVLQDYYLSTLNSRDRARHSYFSFIPAKHSYKLAPSECIASNDSFIYVLATEEKHKTIYNDLKPNIIKLIHEKDKAFTYELSIRLGDGTDNEQELARVYTNFLDGRQGTALEPCEDALKFEFGFQSVTLRKPEGKEPSLAFEFKHQGKLYSKSFDDIPDSSSQKLVLESKTPGTTLTAHLHSSPRNKFLDPIECPYPKAIPLSDLLAQQSPSSVEKSNPDKDGSQNITHSIEVPPDFVERARPDAGSREVAEKKTANYFDDNVLTLDDDTCLTLNLHKATEVIDINPLLKNYNIHDLKHAYFLPAASKLVVNGPRYEIERVKLFCTPLIDYWPHYRVDVSLLHCPIPKFGSWISEDSLKQATHIDRITFSIQAGGCDGIYKSDNIQMIELNLSANSWSEILTSEIRIKHSGSPLIRTMNQRHFMPSKPLYIPLEIDTKSKTLSVLKITSSRTLYLHEMDELKSQ